MIIIIITIIIIIKAQTEKRKGWTTGHISVGRLSAYCADIGYNPNFSR